MSRVRYPIPEAIYLAVASNSADPSSEKLLSCLLCKNRVQDEGHHSNLSTASKDHQKNMRNYMTPGITSYQKIRQEQLKYHPRGEKSAWKAYRDDEGRTYYWNRSDGRTTWVLPPSETAYEGSDSEVSEASEASEVQDNEAA